MRLGNFKLLMGIILLTLFLVGCSGSNDSADMTNIEEVWKEYGASATTGDIERWISLWVDDGIRLAPNAPRSEGIEEIRAALEPAFEIFDINISVTPDEIQILGDTAYTYGTYNMTLTPKGGGETVEDNGKFLTILEKQSDGSWKIAVDCFNTNLPAP